MELNSRHKAFLAVAGVAISALLVDKLLIGTGSPTPAQASPKVSTQQPVSSTALSARGSNTSAVDKLEHLAISQSVNPASAAPESPVPVRPLAGEPGSTAAQTTLTTVAPQTMRLTGVAPAQGVALINGQALRVGVTNPKLPGVKLVSVQAPTRAHRGSAVVEVSGQTHTIEMHSVATSNAR